MGFLPFIPKPQNGGAISRENLTLPYSWMAGRGHPCKAPVPNGGGIPCCSCSFSRECEAQLCACVSHGCVRGGGWGGLQSVCMSECTTWDAASHGLGKEPSEESGRMRMKALRISLLTSLPLSQANDVHYRSKGKTQQVRLRGTPPHTVSGLKATHCHWK